MIRECIEAVVNGRDLDTDEAATAMNEIMTGQATPAQIGALITALRMKGEVVEELVGLARVMRRNALRVNVEGPVVDTCGTGGDGTGTFNISTAAALVAASAGVKVAKARQPGRLQRLRQRRHPGGVWRQGGPPSLARGGVPARGGHRLHVCPRLSPCHASCRGSPSGDRHPHHLQHPGPSHQPSRGAVPGPGRGPRGAGRKDGPGAGPARHRADPW